MTVWVVAYPFVPAGEYLRERTHFFLYPAMVLVLFGTLDGAPLFAEYKPSARYPMTHQQNETITEEKTKQI